MSHPELHTPRLLLREPSPADLAPLTAILSEPAVARIWSGYDAALVQEELLQAHDDVTVLVIATRSDSAAQVLGAIQYSQNHDEEYRHAGIDLFLSTPFQGRGLGSEAIRAVLEHLFETLGHHRVTIDPAATNERAIRTYERLGFRPIGIMRQYERGADGTFHDGLLMELLAVDYRARRDALKGRAARPSHGAVTLSLRLAEQADLPALVPMMVAFNQHERIPWDPVAEEAPLRHLLRSPELGRVLLLFGSGVGSGLGSELAAGQKVNPVDVSPIGYAVITYGFDLEFSGRDAFLTELYLEPGAQGQGLGQQALKLLMSDAKSQGVHALHLLVRTDNQHALSLYRTSGFSAELRMFLTKKLD